MTNLATDGPKTIAPPATPPMSVQAPHNRMPPPPVRSRYATQGIGATGASTVAGAAVSTAGRRVGGYVLECVLFIATLGVGWLIWSFVLWSKGQSPAKSFLGMRCVRTDTGEAASWGTMALRELVGKSLLSTVSFGLTALISAFMVLDDPRQAVWDKIANTIVVDDPDGRLVPAAA